MNTRKQFKAFGRGSIEWLSNKENDHSLVFKRKYQDEELLIVHNLSKEEQNIDIKLNTSLDLLDQSLNTKEGKLLIPAGGFYWFSKDQWID